MYGPTSPLPAQTLPAYGLRHGTGRSVQRLTGLGLVALAALP